MVFPIEIILIVFYSPGEDIEPKEPKDEDMDNEHDG